jgi:hypothetical protein
MSALKPISDSPLLENPGWAACLEAHLLKATDKWQQAAEFRSHAHTLRRMFEDLGIDAVLCVDGRPTCCVFNGRQRTAAEIEQVRRQLWNLGATTLLLVERCNRVDVFSTLVKPSRKDSSGQAAQLSSETIQDLASVELALRLRQLIRRVETGAIYRDREHESLFDPKQAVDRDLLENLKTARNLISPQKSKKGYQRAHALIGRFLFSCYLLDRGIIGPPYLKKNNLPEATDMLGLLNRAPNTATAIEQLSDALHRDFNGSLFGEPFPAGSISEKEVDYLQRLVAGEELRTRQLSLFKLYDFSLIPVELVSAIYEEFLGAEAELESNDNKRNQPRKDGQRLQGAYYTPPRLAELTVDIATEGWDTLLNKRCLDPACGSGIFLVILFVRMAEEWRRRNPKADTTKRYQGLMSLLENNLQGFDIQLTACLITCFSLYLAFLDQMDPKEIIDLRDALERDTREKLLPRILWEREKPRPKGRHFATVRECDFFALPANHEFHLVIGNPPWVSRKPAPATESWLFSKRNPFTKQVSWEERQEEPTSVQRQTLFPAKEIACAFMWKAGLHLTPNGRVCQVLPARVFLSNNTNRFQAAWLNQHRLEIVWLLADYSFILFPSVDCPCFLGRYHPRAETESLGDLEFITPKVELLDPRHAVIPVMPEDQKVLSEAEIIARAERGEAAAAWKKYHWGTPRDARLIERLMRLRKLESLAARPPRMRREDDGGRTAENAKKWWKGVGFQPLTDSDIATADNQEESTSKPWPVWWKPQQHFLTADVQPEGFIIDECPTYGSRATEVRRTLAPELTRPPLVIVNKAFTKAYFSEKTIIFQDDFQTITGPQSDEDKLLFLTAFLNSGLAQYLLFHSSANIGIERDIVRVEEILRLPFPLPEDTSNPQKSQRIIEHCAAAMRRLQNELRKQLIRDAVGRRQETMRVMEDCVAEYFDLCEWEQQLVADTVEVFRPSSTPGSLDSDKLYTAKASEEPHRRTYAQTLVKTFLGWSRTKHLWAEGCTAPKSDLAVVTLGLGSRPKDYTESQMDERVEQILAAIRENTAHHVGAVFRCLRGFAYYEADRVHIVKPLNRRHWTRTAALNDADEILLRMIEEGGWGA